MGKREERRNTRGPESVRILSKILLIKPTGKRKRKNYNAKITITNYTND